MAARLRTRQTAGITRRAQSSSQQSTESVEGDKPEYTPTRIQKFRDACDANDWEYQEDWFGANYRVKAWRNEGEERILMIWRERTFSAEESYYELVDVRKKQVNNQAEAVRFVVDQPDYTFAKDGDGRPVIVRDVFDWSDYGDEEVISAVAGRTITWQNAYTGEHEKGHVPRVGKWTAVGCSSVGRRYLTFADAAGTGFRSVGLDAISRISGGKRKER